jgi:hypothetical protein
MEYKIEMFNFMSLVTYANAIKYVLVYKDFDLNANYPPCIDNSYKFVFLSKLLEI